MLLTHSVVVLLRKAIPAAPGLAECLEGARELDLHYIPSRYPNGLPSGYPHQFYGKETAEKAIAASRKIMERIEELYRIRGVTWLQDEEALEPRPSAPKRENSEGSDNET